VSRPVGHDRLERRGLPQRVEHEVGDLVDGRFPPAPDVVRLAVAPVEDDGLDGAAVVEHVEPLTTVCGRCVERERLVVERQCREVGHDLLGELVRTVVVRAVGDRHRELEGVVVDAHEVVGGGLRGVVRRARSVRRLLGERAGIVEREIAVDLTRRDVVEPLYAMVARRLEQYLCAEDVRADEARRVEDGQAVVRLGREVHDDVDRLVVEQ
jgi:hypothetical protein